MFEFKYLRHGGKRRQREAALKEKKYGPTVKQNESQEEKSLETQELEITGETGEQQLF